MVAELVEVTAILMDQVQVDEAHMTQHIPHYHNREELEGKYLIKLYLITANLTKKTDRKICLIKLQNLLDIFWHHLK